ncbi:uncharacterized protein G2W53_026986 [Senna tora]|uniref:Uncharacterized protein n=1 Tax=Senna tora TaxID=362788 RepID=A0A834TIF9_9FABA|nr:uncharacterized protein G2W53_026986 [Senna tora]
MGRERRRVEGWRVTVCRGVEKETEKRGTKKKGYGSVLEKVED